MRIFWLQVINTLAKTGNTSVVVKALKIKPSLIQSIIYRTENALGITLFHRLPWLNQGHERLWQVAGEKPRIIIDHIDAMLHDMTMAEEFAFIASRKNPSPDARYLIRTRDIERVLVLNGNRAATAARILECSDRAVLVSSEKVERWLGITLFEDLETGNRKIKVLTQGGEKVLPYLAKIYSHYQEILELIGCEDTV